MYMYRPVYTAQQEAKMIDTKIANANRVIVPSRRLLVVTSAPRRRDGSISEVLWPALYSQFDVRF